MFIEMPPIPDFLIATKENTAAARAAWKALPPAKRLRNRKRRQRFDLPKSIETEGLVLLKQIERAKKDKQAARFKALRERSKR